MRQWPELLTPTPVQFIGTCESGQTIYMKREDFLGFSFGGNKCRIGLSFLKDMEAKGGDFLVSYGKKQSNLNRVLATMCRSLDIPSMILSPDLGEPEGTDTFNKLLVRSMGSRYVSCSPDRVAEAVEQILEWLRAQGYRPYYIYGDKFGHGNEAAAREAYRNVYGEIRRWEEEQGIFFDYIFLASATGMTQGGLLAGWYESGGDEQIIGVSVARGQETGEAGVRRYAGREEIPIRFLTEYTCGGYGKYDEDIKTVIREMMEQHGIPLDPTYTGKAYAGMLKWLKDHGAGRGNVLFIHTGGAPLYFDYLRSGVV